MGKRFGTALIILLVVIFSYMGYDYFGYRSANAVSEAAFIRSDRLANLSFKIDGKVIRMLKSENQPVKKGELLAVVDPVDLQIAKKELLHRIEGLENSLAAMKLKKSRIEETLSLKTSIADSDIDSISMKRESLAYRIKAAETKLRKLRKDTLRYERMLEQNLIASSDFESVQTQRDALADEVEGLKKEYGALQAAESKARDGYRLAIVEKRMVAELEKGIAAKTEELKSQREALADIENRIGYTRLYAPFDGIVAKKYFEAPRVVESGTPVYAFIDPSSLYCEVLLSEKKMRGVKPGNRAVVTVDALDGKEFEGEVESIAPTSASTFSLVPRDIASGEFTKLDQRFTVRISMKRIEGLRAGMSATVAIAREKGE
ncbi:HlyD family secretion protein [Hydrogenimonas sp.]